MRGREGTLHFRPTVIPCTHLFDHNGRILRIREAIRDHANGQQLERTSTLTIFLYPSSYI